MRPVTINPRNVTNALVELQTASHENDVNELSQSFTIGNTPAVAQRELVGSSVLLSAAGIGNGGDTTEDLLFTYALAQNSLVLVEQGLDILAAGTLANNADNKTVRLYFGNQVFTLGPVTTAAVTWLARMSLWKTGTNAQLILCWGQIGTTLVAPAILVGAVPDNASITIKVTGQAGTANANDIVANVLSVSAAASDVGNAFATWISDCQKGGPHRTQ
jgi:hypothetical protein